VGKLRSGLHSASLPSLNIQLTVKTSSLSGSKCLWAQCTHPHASRGVTSVNFILFSPNILALSFASLLPQETILLAVVQLLSLLLFYFFYRLTRSTPSPSTTSSIKEGLQPKANLITSARLMWTTFGLITLYLPVSTIAVRALVSPPPYPMLHS
jgi:hypothetical protein